MENILNQVKEYFSRLHKPGIARSNVFHISLEKLWERHQGEPIFFKISIDYLRRNALNETRIFRDLPDEDEYDEFVDLVESGNINKLQHPDMQYMPSTVTIAWFIRIFLFYLPIPLIPNEYELSKRLLDAIDIKLPDIFIQTINDQNVN
eukprot:550079_1